MKKRIIFFCAMIAFALSITLTAAPHAFAQDPTQLSTLELSVWPEYDQPTVLVMIDGTLADTTNLPRQVSVLIPSTAKLVVTTWANADRTFAPEQPSQSTDLGDGYTRVAFSTNAAQYHVEYYDDLLKGAPDKSMDFVYKAAAPATQVTVEVEQPLKATNFSTTPSTQTTRTGSDSFKYYDLQYPALTVGQTITAQVKYTKTDPNPSVITAPASAPVAATPASPSPWSNAFILVVVVVLGLVAVIGFFLLQQRSREPAFAQAGARSRSRKGAERSVTANNVSAFCTQCGYGLASGDLFCPKCGTKRRMV